MDYMTMIWIVVIGAVLLSALLAWSIKDTRRHQQLGQRGKKKDVKKSAKR